MIMNWNLRIFRKDLERFLEIISEFDIGDFSNLYGLLGKIDSIDKVEYELPNICFFIKKTMSGSIPEKLNKHEIFLDHSLILKDDYNLNDDFLSEYKLEINIKSYISKSDEEVSTPYKSCWHLDKHDIGTSPKYTHAIYHLHYGGEYLDGLDTGELSILANPRIPHPPMDIFLSFHFIISNFYSSKEYAFIGELMNNDDYKQIIKRAQERLWKPYFKGFEETNTHQHFTFSNIFPLYIH